MPSTKDFSRSPTIGKRNKSKQIWFCTNIDENISSRFDAGSDSNVVVLVTAPKDPLFLVKSESTEKLRRIRQIRVLVFSDKDIVKVALDGSEKGMQTIK